MSYFKIAIAIAIAALGSEQPMDCQLLAFQNEMGELMPEDRQSELTIRLKRIETPGVFRMTPTEIYELGLDEETGLETEILVHLEFPADPNSPSWRLDLEDYFKDREFAKRYPKSLETIAFRFDDLSVLTPEYPEINLKAVIIYAECVDSLPKSFNWGDTTLILSQSRIIEQLRSAKLEFESIRTQGARFPQIDSADLERVIAIRRHFYKAFSTPPIPRVLLPLIGHIATLRELDLSSSNVTNADLSVLSRLKLKQLIISDNAVSDEGLEHIQPEDLESLSIGRTRISGASLIRFPNLKYLSAPGCGIDDETCSLLQELKYLETLSLAGTRITKKSLPNLLNIKSLKHLYLSKNLLDEAERQQFEAMHTQISVTWIGE